MEFKEVKEYIKRDMKRSDIGAICKQTGLSRAVYQTSMKKDTFDDLTSREFMFIDALTSHIKSRIEQSIEVRKKIEQNVNATGA